MQTVFFSKISNANKSIYAQIAYFLWSPIKKIFTMEVILGIDVN